MEIHDLLNRVCKEIPDGWTITINAEKGSAWVNLSEEGGRYFDIDGADMTIGEQVEEALKKAIEES